MNKRDWMEKDEKALMPSAFQATPKKGDVVEVRDVSTQTWQQRIFLAAIENIRYPIVCVQVGDEEIFRKGEKVSYTCWGEMRPYTPFEVLCSDGVTVTDPEQVVYRVYENLIFDGKAKNCSEKDYFSTKAAAEDHLRNIEDTINMKKTSSIEWFAEVVAKMGYVSTDILEQAIAMHKQEIVDAINLPREKRWYNALLYNNSGEQYYNEHYGK